MKIGSPIGLVQWHHAGRRTLQTAGDGTLALAIRLKEENKASVEAGLSSPVRSGPARWRSPQRYDLAREHGRVISVRLPPRVCFQGSAETVVKLDRSAKEVRDHRGQSSGSQETAPSRDTRSNGR